MISIFFYLLSIFCVVYYGVIIAYSGLRTSFVRFWLFSAVISAFAAVFLQSSIYLSLPSIIHRIIKLFTFIILAFFLIILLKIWNTQHFCKNQEVEADYLIVPGAIVRGEKPSNDLLARIQTTFYYLSAHEHTIAILTGYQNANAKISQGKCMQQELIRMGIPAYRLLVEEHARTTEENLRFSKEYISLRNPRVCVISNDFHLYRIIKLAEKCGFHNVFGLAAKTPAPILIHCYVREVFAVIKSFLR